MFQKAEIKRIHVSGFSNAQPRQETPLLHCPSPNRRLQMRQVGFSEGRSSPETEAATAPTPL